MSTLLSIGATGSIGRHVVDTARSAGWDVRALVRDHDRARSRLPEDTELVAGSLESPEDIRRAAEGVDAVVFTHGTYSGDPHAVDYRAVEHLLRAVHGRTVRISLMTMIAVTDAAHGYGGNFGIVHAKRRSERLLRASGQPYTIVRPSWFGMAGPEQQRLEFLQGDTNISGGPADGVIGRAQIGRVLVEALTSEPARGKTFELHAVDGERPEDLDPLFAALDPDAAGELDGAHDPDSQPFADEPDSVRHAVDELRVS